MEISIKDKTKAQSAFEFLGVALIGMLLFVPLFFIALDLLGGRSFEAALGKARTASSSLADSADALCLQPEGSKTEVLVSVPEFVDADNSSIANKTVKFALRYKDRLEFVFATTRCDVNGTLPNRSGTYIFEVKRESALVNITQKTG